MTAPTCTGTRADGTPCSTKFGLNAANGLCLAHDPERAEELADARSRGGYRTAELRRPDIPAAPRSLEEARDAAAWCAQAVAEGKIEADVARVYVAALREFRAAYERADVERTLRAEVAAMRQQLRDLKARRA